MRSVNRLCILCLGVVLATGPVAGALSGASWNGALTDGSGKPVATAVVNLHSTFGGRDYPATTAADGKFAFAAIAAGSYEVSVRIGGKEWKAPAPLVVIGEETLSAVLQISTQGQTGAGHAEEELRIVS